VPADANKMPTRAVASLLGGRVGTR
jgi:hypothetical protein